MSRLTEKNKFDIHYSISISKKLLQNAYDKLGKLEDLEEELGCPLEIAFKALKEGIYYIYPNGNIVLERCFKLNHYSSGWCLIKPKLNFKLEDYKKTWWLKRDKSE